MFCFEIQEEREEEEILLQPIGPGVQTLESGDTGTLRQRSMTPVVLSEQGINSLRQQAVCAVQ